MKVSLKLLGVLQVTGALCLMLAALVPMVLAQVVTLFHARRFCAEVVGARAAKAILSMLGVKVVLAGPPPPAGQVVYMCNHTSSLDMFILIALALPNTRYFMKRASWRVLPVGLVGFFVGTFFIPPQEAHGPRVRCFKRAEQKLRRTGESVYLSPEGTRVVTGSIGRFNKGAFHLATALGAPIVPLYLVIPRAMNPGRAYWAIPGTVIVHVLPAMPTSGWRVEDVATNKESVREAFIAFERSLRQEPESQTTAARAPG